MTKKQDNCMHDFTWYLRNLGLMESLMFTGKGIAITVKCSRCGILGLEHYTQEYVDDGNGIILYEYWN